MHDRKPLVRSHVLIVLGGLLTISVTLFGLFNNPGELIRQDVRLGPVIAASRVFIPLFAVMGVIFLLAGIKKCKACGKIFFWRKNSF